MSLSKVEICNRALSSYVGASRINSLTEGTPASEECSLHYDGVIRTLLERHWWTWATGRVTLAERVNDRQDLWGYRYEKPSGVLAYRWVNNPQVAALMRRTNQSQDIDREMTGDSIYCDAQYAACEYTREVTDPSEFPASFVDAAIAALAAAIVAPLTESSTRERKALEGAASTLDTAIALDERNRSVMGAPVADVLRSRGITS